MAYILQVTVSQPATPRGSREDFQGYLDGS